MSSPSSALAGKSYTSSPGAKPASMRQSLLAFKPRTSSSLAIQASSSAEDDEDDSGAIESEPSTPPRATNGTYIDVDDAESSALGTPPAANHKNGFDETNASSYITIDDSDDGDLSDPPPLDSQAVASKPKLLTKKRPSSAASSSSAVNGTAAKKPKKADASSTNTTLPRKVAAPGESLLCHHHRTLCSETLLRCTYLRGKGTQCTLKYCDRALEGMYSLKRTDILNAGRTVTDDIDPTEHVSSREASYFFKCPRCSGTCKCSVCRQKAGLPPLGPAKGPRNKIAGDSGNPSPGSSSSSPKGKVKSEVKAKSKTKSAGLAASQSKQAKAPAKAKASTSASASSSEPAAKKAKTKAAPAADAKGKGKAAKNVPTLFKGASKGKAADTIKGWTAARQTSLPRPLKAPAAVAAPELEVIPTKLHRDNFDARAWIYETLVRFDFIRVPKATLGQLDKFDLWTHRQMQMVLERILVAIAGLHSIQSGQPKAGTTECVKAFRKFPDDLTRGEPWQAARKFCENSNVEVPTLPHVDRVFEDESKEAVAADSGPTLLSSRPTRARRAAEVKALERVKLQSLADMERDFDSESDTSDAAPRGRGQRARRNVDYAFADESAAEDDDDEDEEGEAPRRSGRQTARQRAVVQARDSTPEGVRRSSRSKHTIAIGTPSESGDEGSGRREASIAPSARSSTRAESVADSRASEATPATDADAVEPPKEAEPIPAPEMEEKVAIVVALLEVILQTAQVAEELKSAGARLTEIEKFCKEDLRELEKEWDDVRPKLYTSAPSMTQAEQYAKWKKNKEKTEREFKLRIADVKVNAYRQTEAHKIRTGPLGFDADGREFWQLTEFNETMPANTAGRWSWCVLVYGEPMTKHAPLADAMPNNGPNVSPLKGFLVSQEVVEDGDVKMVDMADVATKRERVKDEFATPPPRETENGDVYAKNPSGKVFMGTNYPASIKEVISFIKYRCAQLDYEEIKAQRDAEEAAAVTAETSGSPSTSTSGTSFSRKAKRQLKEAQDARKKRVDELCEKLENCRRYYMWHGAEVEEGDPGSTF